MNQNSKIPEKVIGMLTDESGQLMLFLKLQAPVDEAVVMAAKEAYVKCPQLILEFYKENLRWHDASGDVAPPRKRSKTKKSGKNNVVKNGDVTAGNIPEEVLGATYVGGYLYFLIKWVGIEEGDLIVAEEAQLICPQLLLKWYEERISWNDSK